MPEDNQKENEGFEAWLGPWDEMPEGCAAVLGKVPEEWQGRSIVRSAHLGLFSSPDAKSSSVTASARKGHLKHSKSKGPVDFELCVPPQPEELY